MSGIYKDNYSDVTREMSQLIQIGPWARWSSDTLTKGAVECYLVSEDSS